MNEHVRSVALLTHSRSGGVWSVTTFLWDALSRDPLFRPEIFYLATSAQDQASVRLLAPNTWKHNIKVTSEYIEKKPVRHVGAFLSEFEFQRYHPRKKFTQILNQYDLVQVVAGTPAWAGVAIEVDRPVCLFVATTIAEERKSFIRSLKGWRKLWSKWMTSMNKRIEQQVLPKMDMIFAESHYTRNAIAPYVLPHRLQVAPPGVDTEFFHPTKSKSGKDAYVLSVGRFSDPRKNVRLLFQAYGKIYRSLSNPPRLVLAGRTRPSDSDMEFARKLGILSNVVIHQDVSKKRLAELYRNAELFVLSSDEEGLGIVIVEAMASGIPVVSTNCGGPVTAIREGVTGFLTPIGDAEALAERILFLLKNDVLRMKMGRRAREVAVEQFSFEAASKVYLDTYRDLLGL